VIHGVRAIGSNLHLKYCVGALARDLFDRQADPAEILSNLPVVGLDGGELA
jgi:hypothetical protein